MINSLNNKLTLFDYFVDELIQWQREVQPELNHEQALQTFTFKRYMKLLYFTGLQSVKENSMNVDDTLFGVFDNFVALKSGPVEEDIYNNRTFLPKYQFDGQYLTLRNIPLNWANDYDERLIVLYESKLKNALKELKTNRYLPFSNTHELILLSHQQPIWQQARLTNSGRLTVNNIYDLKEEYRLFSRNLNDATISI